MEAIPVRVVPGPCVVSFVVKPQSTNSRESARFLHTALSNPKLWKHFHKNHENIRQFWTSIQFKMSFIVNSIAQCTLKEYDMIIIIQGLSTVSTLCQVWFLVKVRWVDLGGSESLSNILRLATWFSQKIQRLNVLSFIDSLKETRRVKGNDNLSENQFSQVF